MSVFLSFMEENANLIGVVSSLCMLLVTAIYAIITWWQARYTKRTLVESITSFPKTDVSKNNVEH